MKQIRDMTTAEWRKAWTEIAVAFEDEPKHRTTKRCAMAMHGLCYALYSTTGVDCFDVEDRMNDFAQQAESVHWWPPKKMRVTDTVYNAYHRRKYDLLRSTFAAIFAAMTPKEFLAICHSERGKK